MNNLPNPAPAATPTAPAGASAPATVQQCLALLSILGQAVQALTDAASALVDSPASHASAAVANALTSAGALLSIPPFPTTAPLPVPTLPAFLRTTGPWLAGLLYAVVPAQPLASVVDNNEKWFAITRGKYVGLTKNSAVLLNAVTGVTTALSQKHQTQAIALAHFNTALLSGAVAVIN